MQDTFQWTDDLVYEFVNQLCNGNVVGHHLQQFKSSKSPKKEWEIVAYQVRKNKIYHVRNKDGRGKIWDSERMSGSYIREEDLSNPEVEIFSVRRLSDGEVFSVGDRIKPNENCSPVVITQFTTTDNVLRVHNKDGYFPSGDQFWRCMFKLPQPILTTVDGVEIFEGDRISIVFDDFGFAEMSADDCHLETYKQCRIFSTSTTANAFIAENKPLLSLNDVKKICEHSDQAKALAELTALVKQKLNQ